MESKSTGDEVLIATVRAYRLVSNSYDINAAVAMFAEDACVVVDDKGYCGHPALRAADEYGMRSRTEVEFSDFAVEGSTVHCTFFYRDEVDRVTGMDGTYSKADFTFEEGRIKRFVCCPGYAHALRRGAGAAPGCQGSILPVGKSVAGGALPRGSRQRFFLRLRGRCFVV